MSTITEFKVDPTLLKLGQSPEKQLEIWKNLNNLQTGVTQLAPNSVSGLGMGVGSNLFNQYAIDNEIILQKQKEELESNFLKNEEKLKLDKEKKKLKNTIIYISLGLVTFGIVIYKIKK